MKGNIFLNLQKDVVAESEAILKLGLLFGEDIEATTEDLPAVLSFQHKLIQEYLAAVYIAENAKGDTTSTFLSQALPSWEMIQNHREVVQFACGILADIDARPITNHAAKLMVQHTHNQLNTGVVPSIVHHWYNLKFMPRDHTGLSLIEMCQREGNLSTAINPYLFEYPACGRPLAEVLANSELVYITYIDENDPLELNPSPAQIIVKLVAVDGEEYDRLWGALHATPQSLVALELSEVRSANVTKLSHFHQLKYLYIEDYEWGEEASEDLAESIDAWGPQPQLRCFRLSLVPITRSLMTGLCKCSHLMSLHFCGCNLSGKMSILMASPPPALRSLWFQYCTLISADLDYMTQAMHEGQLP